MKTKDGLKYVLGIETAAILSVAVTAGDSLAAERSLDAGRNLDSLLMETIKAVLEISGIKPEELYGIAVSSGPGSFTGLRVGLAAAKGLAFALGKPIAGVPSLDGLAYPLNPSVDCLICPLLDAKNGRVYSCLYSYCAGTGRKERITGYMALPLEKLLGKINKRTFFLCDGSFHEPIKTALGDDSIIMPPEYGRPKASSISFIAYERLLRSKPGIYDLRPVYARSPEAQEKAAEEMPEIKIERMRHEDLGQVIGIEKSSFPVPWSEEMFKSELCKEHATFLVARIGEEIAGYIGGWAICDEFHLVNLAVSPGLRGRGIGGKLLKNLIDSVKSQDAVYITLEVRENNLPAIAMYRKFGFSIAGRRKRYYGDSGEDAVIMSIGNIQGE